MLSSDKPSLTTTDNTESRQLLLPLNRAEERHHYAAEEKYKILKRKLKEMMELNESISKDYKKTKKKVRLLMLERDVLLDNIARIGRSQQQQHSPLSSGDEEDSNQAGMNNLVEGASDTDEDDVLATSSNSSSTSSTTPRSLPPAHQPRQHQRPSSYTQSRRSGEGAVTSQNHMHKDMTTVSSAPPKRSKMNRLATPKTRRVQPVDRDEEGMVKLPQQIGVLTVVSLGKIVHDRDTFHNERYIFPVGFSVQRTYPSMTDPTKNTVIVSTIIDGGAGPLFQVVAEDMPDEPIIANSATGAWTVVVRRSNEIRHREHSNSASGPDYYGFKHPTIAKLIQDLPGTEKLKYYIPQNFEEMEPRAAKGVMAAAQKKRGNLEQMGNANVRAPRVATIALTTDEQQQQPHHDQEDPLTMTMTSTSISNLLLDPNDDTEIDELHSENDGRPNKKNVYKEP